MVEEESTFTKVLDDFQQWLSSEDLVGKKFAFVTCGDWDLQLMLPSQCYHSGVPVPDYFQSWINIKTVRYGACVRDMIARHRYTLLFICCFDVLIFRYLLT